MKERRLRTQLKIKGRSLLWQGNAMIIGNYKRKIDMEKIKKKNELKEHIREIKIKQKEKLLIDLKSFTNK